MKKIFVVCLSVILVTVFLARLSVRGNSTAENDNLARTSPPTQNVVSRGSSQGSHVYEIDGKKIVSEVRTGLGVALRADQLRKKNKGFAKAYQNLIKRGHKPLFAEAGLTVLGIDTSRPAISKTTFSGAQDIVDGDYEMSFFPVDTGDPNIWEGLIYVKTPARNGTYAVKHDTIHQDLSQTEIYYENYYPGGGGGDLEQQVRLPGRGHGSVRPLAFSASVNPAPLFWELAPFFGCLAGGLYEVVQACRFSGPFFWHCVAIGGAVVIIGCMVMML